MSVFTTVNETLIILKNIDSKYYRFVEKLAILKYYTHLCYFRDHAIARKQTVLFPITFI